MKKFERNTEGNRRSIYLPNEGPNDVLDALNKSKDDEELKHIVSERLRANGWDREKELAFRDNAKTCNFVLGSYRTKQTTVETPIADRYKARLPAGVRGNELRTQE